MTANTRAWILAGVHFVVWCGLGLWVVPTVYEIGLTTLTSPSLPWLTRMSLRPGGSGYVQFAVAGAVIIFCMCRFENPRWVRWSLGLLLLSALLCAVVALAWPLLVQGLADR